MADFLNKASFHKMNEEIHFKLSSQEGKFSFCTCLGFICHVKETSYDGWKIETDQ